MINGINYQIKNDFQLIFNYYLLSIYADYQYQFMKIININISKLAIILIHYRFIAYFNTLSQLFIIIYNIGYFLANNYYFSWLSLIFFGLLFLL